MPRMKQQGNTSKGCFSFGGDIWLLSTIHLKNGDIVLRIDLRIEMIPKRNIALLGGRWCILQVPNSDRQTGGRRRLYRLKREWGNQVAGAEGNMQQLTDAAMPGCWAPVGSKGK